MLGIPAFLHRLFPAGVLSKCAYLFVAVRIVHLFCKIEPISIFLS